MKHIGELINDFSRQHFRGAVVPPPPEKVWASWDFDDIPGVPTGLSDLDKMTGGLRPGCITVVAASSGFGKSSFVLSIAFNAALRYGKHIGIFSPEMSGNQLVQRLLAMDTGVDSLRFRLGQIDDDEWPAISRSLGTLASAPIFIDDTPGITFTEMETKAHSMAEDFDLDLIVIDCVQAMRNEHDANMDEGHVQQFSEVSQALKSLAQETGLPVLASSNISAQVQSRICRIPTLADIGEIAILERDTDIVMFIYREELYDPETEKKGIAEIHVVHHRSGPLGTINLRFFQPFTRFADLEVLRR